MWRLLIDAPCVLAALLFWLAIGIAVTYQRCPPPWDDTEPTDVPRDNDERDN